MLPLVCMGAHARPPMFDGFLAGERDRAERPAGLRESLAPRDDREESAPTRRKLSTEERSALRRDLRDATAAPAQLTPDAGGEDCTHRWQ